MAAQIVINDGGGPVTGSTDNDVTFIGVVHTLSNFSDAGVLAWQWTLLDKPAGSAAALTTPTAAISTVTPDIPGDYLIELRTYSDVGATVLDGVDVQAAGVRYVVPFNWLVPAAGETSQQDASRGWAGSRNPSIRQTRFNLNPEPTLVQASGPVTATHGALVLYNPAAGGFTINAPASPVAGERWSLKNVTVSVNAMTVSGNGNSIETPDGVLLASFVIGIAFAGLSYLFDGTNWVAVDSNTSFPLRGPDGSVGVPTYSFASDTDVGLFRPAVNQLGLAAFSEAVIVDNDSATPSLRPDVANVWDLGESGFRWKDLHSERALVGNGTVGAPAYAFTGDTDVGLFRVGANHLGLGANSEAVIVDNDSATPSLRPDVANVWDLGESGFRWKDLYSERALVGDGNQVFPSHSFASDAGNGLYLQGPDNVGITANGFRVVSFTNGQIQSQSGSAAAPPHSFIGDSDTGMYADSADNKLKFASGGVLGMTLLQLLDSVSADEVGLDLAVEVNKISGTNNYTGIKVDVTETAAPGPDDRLLDLQVGSVSQRYVTNTGAAIANSATVGAPAYSFIGDTDTGLFGPAANQLGLAAGAEAVIVDNDSATPSLRPDVDATWDLGEASFRWQNFFCNGVIAASDIILTSDATIGGALNHDGTTVGFYGTMPAVQSAAYTRNATIVEDRTLLASASATIINNNNVLAALIADLQATGNIG